MKNTTPLLMTLASALIMNATTAKATEPVRSQTLTQTPSVRIYYCYAKGTRPPENSKYTTATDVYATSMEHALATAASFFWNSADLDMVREADGRPVLINDRAIKFKDIVCVE